MLRELFNHGLEQYSEQYRRELDAATVNLQASITGALRLKGTELQLNPHEFHLNIFGQRLNRLAILSDLPQVTQVSFAEGKVVSEKLDPQRIEIVSPRLPMDEVNEAVLPVIISTNQDKSFLQIVNGLAFVTKDIIKPNPMLIRPVLVSEEISRRPAHLNEIQNYRDLLQNTVWSEKI